MKRIKTSIVLITLLLVTAFGYSQDDTSDDKLLQHVLLFQWTEGHDVEVKAEVLSLFKNLPSKIEGLESFEVQNVTKSSGNFSVVLTFQFTSEDALKIYQEHPDHKRVMEIAPPLLSGFAEYDYWK